MRDYLILDVFADRPLAGNPLAVIPDARGLDPATMQALAREFNLSETVFLWPPATPGGPVPARIFTPGREVPFAGHPTVGAGVALALAGQGPDITLDLAIGALSVQATADPLQGMGAGRAHVTRTGRLDRVHTLDAATVAACVGLPPEAVVTATHPPVSVSFGLPFAIAELTDTAALAAARPDTERFRAAEARWPSALDFATYLYVRNGTDVQARMFAPLDGIPEDPATGSAAAALAAYLAETLARDLDLSIAQGIEMGRPSRIGVRAWLAGGRAAGIVLQGAAAVMARGQIAA
ncbi:MAG: PhzF family phenazine biosynthesis protein [Rhodobacteraceae bacterium]|jgi:trans-2,3-dihydro-3-hydroxyanthranilate isomerase|nr:PhzF family phenazine biosynthesis protein [Paracoccaceae bacterium]